MQKPSTTRRLFSPWLVATALCVLYVAIIFFANGHDPLVFVTLGTEFSEQDSSGTEGYDGQFVYFIAQDPTGAAEYIDVPAYRYQRILLPILARLLAFGIPQLIPWTLLLVNIIALASSTYLLQQLLIKHRISPWFALVYSLFPGVLMSVRLSLNEPLAYGLVIGAIWFFEREHPWFGYATLALAALTKETTLLFVAGFILWELLHRRWMRIIIGSLITGLPFAVWQVVLALQFGRPGVGSGGDMATPFELIPFNGLWRIYTDTGNWRIFLIFAVLLIPSVVLPSLWAIWRSGKDLLNQKHDYAACLLLANAAVMPFVPFSTFREPLGILRFIVGLVLAVVLYGTVRHDRRVLRLSVLWLTLLAIVVTSG